MADHRTPGNSTVERLARRADMGLQKKDAPDGGEVYSGELARKALRAVGARAMTLDHNIIVDDGFDFDKAEDAALYAHEQVHMEGSGGADMHVSAKDSEETAARAVESMVLHRARSGESVAGIMREAKEVGGTAMLAADAGAAAPARATGAAGTGGTPQSEVDPAKSALQALLATGKTQEQVVKDLTRWVLEQVRAGEEVARFRSSPTRFAPGGH